MREIFKSYDSGNRGKISIEYLPKILRLLNYNIGKSELQDLQLVVDRKALGYFSMQQLVEMLSDYKFKTDKRQELLEAFQEIDQNADGFIPKREMEEFMKRMGEPLEENEVSYLLDLCATLDSEVPGEVDIEALSALLVPSDDIIEDLTQQANQAIKN